MIASIIAVALTWIGIVFILISAIGIIRMPDVYTRMSAVTKAVTLGVGFILLGTVFHFNSTSVLLKATVIFVFLLFSLSVAAHVIGLAAYNDRTRMTYLTFLDELKDMVSGKEAPDKAVDPDKEAKQADDERGQ